MPGKFDLRYEEFTPIQPLRKYIECFWEMSGKITSRKPVQETLVPGGRVELIFSPSSEFLWYGKNRNNKPKSFSGTFLLGQRNSVSYMGLKGNYYLFGIRFRYGCLPLFINLPADSYSNKITPLAENSPAMKMLTSELNVKTNAQKFIAKLEDWLLRLQGSPEEDWVKLQDMIQKVSIPDYESIPIKKIIENYGWNYKKTERLFARYIGFPPRTFFKLVRFRYALEKIKEKPDSLTSAAHRLGFYDQSHFIREFHNYTGDNPSSFLKHPPAVAKLLYKLSK